jgi:prephenate dehydrogenase
MAGMAWLAELQVTIIGLGLMGGSLALALHGRVGRLCVVDRNPTILEMAIERGVADLVTGDPAEGVSGADLVILATPVRSILELVSEMPGLRPDGCMLLDLGSTKRDICAAMAALPPGFQAIGGHPMCGKETSGFTAAEATLFQGRNFVLSPAGERSSEHVRAVVTELVAAIGAVVLVLPADEHDQIVALTSHLPYLLATLLMTQVAGRADENPFVWPASGPGLRDMTRLAGSNTHMMADILATNRAAILSELRRYGKELDELIARLENVDEAALLSWLAARQRDHIAFRGQK